MKVKFTLPSLIEVSLNWYGILSIGKQGNIFLYSSDKSDIKSSQDLEKILSEYLTFEFYSEEEKNKVMIRWKKEIIITIK